MRILFTTRGSAGHVGPLAPVAHAAVRAGHEVLVAGQPRHAANVERLGLPFAGLADPPESEWGPLMARLPEVDFDEANALMVGEFFGRIDTTAALPGLRALVTRWRPDVMVRENWEYASALVAELHGIPLARVALGLVEMEEMSIRLAAPALTALRAELGLQPDPAGDRLRDAPYLTVMPQALEDPAAPAPARTHRFRHDPPGEPPALPEWWPGNDDPLVYLTFGSVTAGDHLPFFPALYRDAIAALAPLPVRLLVTVGEPRELDELGALPANVRVERWVPQDAVLPHAAVVVGHGGHGTTVGALRHGVPLVVLPLFSMDQWANATAIARAGAGVAVGERRAGRSLRHVPSSADDLAAVADAVRSLLGDGPERHRTRDLADEMQALPPVASAVDVVTSLKTAAAA
jgi:UDP:flavonoid glycosyltransferase YjiC (YdhE family)